MIHMPARAVLARLRGRPRVTRNGLAVAGTLLAVASLSTACTVNHGVIVPGASPPATIAIPTGSQIGTGTVPVSCNLPLFGNTTFIAQGTGAVGTVVGPGQQFYLTDARGALEVPTIFMSLASLVGATTIDASVSTLDINASNASPATVNAAATPITITGIPVTPGKSATVQAPQTGTLTIGPFTAGQSGLAAVSIGAISVTITLHNAKGSAVFIPITISCAAPTPPLVLVGLTINAAFGGPASKVTGVNAPAFTVPAGDVEGSLNVPVPCTLSGIGAATLGGTLTGELPAILPSGQQYTLQASSGALNLPGSVVDQLLQAYPGATTLSGSITDLEINAQDSTPSVLNVANPPITVTPQPLVSGQSVNVLVPTTGTMNVGPFTAGSAGFTHLTWGKAAGSFTLADAAGNPVGQPVQVSCQPPAGPVTLLWEPVTSGPVPMVTSVAPSSGPVAGGTTITITGTGFTNVEAVNVGNGQATFTVNSATQIVATVPPGAAAGAADVTVLGPNGPSALVPGDQFTYTG